jgi:exonuclease III
MDVIALEAEGVCICGGDFNVVLNQHLDTTSLTRNINKLSKLINTAWDDIGFCDVWRHINPFDTNYTHYSAPHCTYSRIDYFFMPKSDC